METERATLALGSQNQAIQLSNGARGFMRHERLTHDSSLNLMFAEQGQRQIVLIPLRPNNTMPFILREKVRFFFLFFTVMQYQFQEIKRYLTYSK